MEDRNEKEDKEERVKKNERTLGFVIDKVKEWRRLYNGYFDDEGNHKRMKLADAADKISVKKKTLDDYLGLIRMGSELGYKFHENVTQKVKHLRDFIDEKKVSKRSQDEP